MSQKFGGISAFSRFLENCKNLFATKDYVDDGDTNTFTLVKEYVDDSISSIDISTDETLSIQGMPADAKAVGDALESKVDISILDDYYLKTEADVLHTELHDYIDVEVANLVGTAPETLNTIEELATAFQENEEVVEVLNQAIGQKSDVGHVHSWNELEDKPFGEETEKQLLFSVTHEGSANNGFGNNIDLVLVEGEVYTVELTGLETKDYIAKTDDKGFIYLGEDTVVGGDNNDDYIIIYDPTANTTFYYFKIGDYSPRTLSIYGDVKTIKQLDEKFIPDTISRVSNVNDLLSIEQDRISSLEEKVGEGFEEITEAEIDEIFETLLAE